MTLEELLAESIRIQDENKELEAKRKAIADKQLEINRLIAEEKKKLELEKVQVIIIDSIRDNNIVIIDTNGTPRQDVLELLRATPSRYFDFITSKNEINIQFWTQFKNSLDTLPNINLSYKDKNKEFLENYFTEPLWHVKMSDKFIIVKSASRNKDNHKLSKIPSAQWNTTIKATTVPFSEGWRVIQVLGDPSESVLYEPNVLELIHKQVEQRKKMDEVALKGDADIPNPFVGINPETGKNFELKPFQRAGVFFVMNALGLEVPKPKPKW